MNEKRVKISICRIVQFVRAFISFQLSFQYQRVRFPAGALNQQSGFMNHGDKINTHGGVDALQSQIASNSVPACSHVRFPSKCVTYKAFRKWRSKWLILIFQPLLSCFGANRPFQLSPGVIGDATQRPSQ